MCSTYNTIVDRVIRANYNKLWCKVVIEVDAKLINQKRK